MRLCSGVYNKIWTYLFPFCTLLLSKILVMFCSFLFLSTLLQTFPPLFSYPLQISSHLTRAHNIFLFSSLSFPVQKFFIFILVFKKEIIAFHLLRILICILNSLKFNLDMIHFNFASFSQLSLSLGFFATSFLLSLILSF